MADIYDISERQVEVYVYENLPAKYFVRLGVDQKAPDHSTLSVFSIRITKNGNLAVFEQLLEEIVEIAKEPGAEYGSIQVMIVYIVKRI